jgi:hypothetical protein
MFAVTNECDYEKRTGRKCKYDHHIPSSNTEELNDLKATKPFVDSLRVMMGKMTKEYVRNWLESDPALHPFVESVLEEFEDPAPTKTGQEED